MRNIYNKNDTFTVESVNADLRHYIPILRRRSRCFPRSLDTLQAVLEVFADAYNAFGVAKMKFRHGRDPNARELPFNEVPPWPRPECTRIAFLGVGLSLINAFGHSHDEKKLDIPIKIRYNAWVWNRALPRPRKVFGQKPRGMNIWTEKPIGQTVDTLAFLIDR